MKEKDKIWVQFLEFEKENDLFNLQDVEKTYYWDIIRYEIYQKLLWKDSISPSSDVNKVKIITRITQVWQFVLLFFGFSKKKVLFYLASRNKDKRGEPIDQNAKAVCEFFSKKNTLLIESFSHNLNNAFFLPQMVYRKIYKKRFFDFSPLLNLLNRKFGTVNIDNASLNKILNNYYSDLSFFKTIIKRRKIEFIFVTQNGIQKGLFKAGKDLGVKVFEFQHGVVNEGHLAYNYPKMQYKKEQITLPDVILSLSPFWFSELFLPQVEICPIGNDYFYNPIQNCSLKKGITIISANVYGQSLLDFILDEEVQKIVENIPIFFKLHPNQFHEKSYYESKLKSAKNIKVITNEQSVGELLTQCDTLFTILSTAVYEALQSQRKVILLKENPYEHQQHIFYHPNIHLVGNSKEFSQALDKNIDYTQHEQFFTPFDKKAFLKLV